MLQSVFESGPVRMKGPSQGGTYEMQDKKNFREKKFESNFKTLLKYWKVQLDTKTPEEERRFQKK